MSTRKAFLAGAAALPLLAASPAPSPAPSASPTPKPPTELAHAFAERMRAFDPKLTDKNIADIAAGIDYNLKAGTFINPKGRVLKNWDEPVTVFEVPE